MYQLAYIQKSNSRIEYIKGITENGATLSIPINPDNTDYQQYLAWVAEGNTPIPADEPTA